MIVRFFLNSEEVKLWDDAERRVALVDRCRELAVGDDIDSIHIHYGAQGDVLELAPAGHQALATRMRQIGARDLANLVDPDVEKDVLKRQKVADQIHKLGSAWAPKAPYGATLEPGDQAGGIFQRNKNHP